MSVTWRVFFLYPEATRGRNLASCGIFSAGTYRKDKKNQKNNPHIFRSVSSNWQAQIKPSYTKVFAHFWNVEQDDYSS